MKTKQSMKKLLSLALCLSAPVSMMISMPQTVLAQEATTAPQELPDVSDKKENGTWGTVKYYLLDDGTLYFGPGQTATTPKKFYLASYVTRIVCHPDFDSSPLTSMYEMFYNYTKLEDISGLAEWDISNVTTMYGAFANTKIKNTDALSSWESSKLGGLNSTFSGCTELTDLSGLANLGKSGSIRDMNGAFLGCTSLESLHGLEDWFSAEESSLDSMSSTFEGCTKLSDVSALSGWNTMNATNLCQTFNSCPISDLSVFSNWNVSKVSGFAGTFTGNTALTSLKGLENWNTASASSYAQMFENCTNLKDANAMSHWKTEKWFRADNILNNTAVTHLDLSGWNTAQMFFSDTSSYLFSNPLTAIRLSADYLSMIRPNKQALVKSKNSDTYGDSWVSQNLHGPYTSAELTDGTVTWTEDMDGWWGRAKTATLVDEAHGLTKTISLPADLEVSLPLGTGAFDGSAFHARVIGWKKANSEETITKYTAGLSEENIELNPVWEFELHANTWTFDANGGTGTMDSIEVSVPSDTSARVPDCSFTREGYTFTGWNTKADGSGDNIAVGDTIDVDYSIDQFTVYAQWKKIPSHQVAFEANGGTGDMETLIWNGEEDHALPKNGFTRTDYEFTGWNTKADGTGITYADEAQLSGGEEDSELTLYAQWKKIPSHMVTFAANGGTGTMEPLLWKGEEGNKLPKNTFTRFDWIFTGWNTKADGTGTAYADEAQLTGGEDDTEITLYAQWKAVLHYDLLDQAIEKGESIASKSFKSNQNETLNAAIAEAKTVRTQSESQIEIDQAARTLNQVLLSLRLTTDTALPSL